MNRFRHIVAFSAGLGLSCLSHAAFTGEGFDPAVPVPTPTFDDGFGGYQVKGDTAFVSDLGADPASQALRFGPSGALAVDSPDLVSIWTEAVTGLGGVVDASPFSDTYASIVAELTAIDSPFLGATSASFLYSNVFDVSPDSLLKFDYTVNANSVDSTFDETSFYFIMDDQGWYDIFTFGDSSIVSPLGAVSGTETVDTDGSDNQLSESREYFFAIGSVFGEEEYGTIDPIDFPLEEIDIKTNQFLEKNYYYLTIDNIGVVPLLDDDGSPIQAVPEPSTYGLIGGAFLAGLIGYRRFKAKKAVAAA